MKRLGFKKPQGWLFWLLSLAFCGLICFAVFYSATAKKHSYSCSTFDDGRFGSSSFFATLSHAGLPVSRLQKPLYEALAEPALKQATLLILSPPAPIEAWEWELILNWVGDGGKLITSGIAKPPDKLAAFVNNQGLNEMIFTDSAIIRIHNIHGTRSPGDTLPLHLDAFTPIKFNDASFLIKTFPKLPAHAHGYLSINNRLIGIKKSIGEGTWTQFSIYNPFANRLLADSSWFNFAFQFFGTSDQNESVILFDEYHQGFSSSKGLWELFGYMGMQRGLLITSSLLVLLLLITGIRILAPTSPEIPQHRNPVESITAAAQLLIRYKAANAILSAEYATIKRLLRLPDHASAEEILRKTHNRLSPKNKEFLEKLGTQNSLPADKKNIVKSYNFLASFRKELRI